MTARALAPYPDATDIRATLLTNPVCPPPLENGWWGRTPSQITGLTIHHTLSHSPWATAQYYIQKSGGRPSIPYHYWVCTCGQVLYCLDLVQGCWHDHTGHKNANVSIGMAGSLHEVRPTLPQLASAVALTTFLVFQLDLVLSEVLGHNQRSAPVGYPTTCPGWDSATSGYWRHEFLSAVVEQVNSIEKGAT